VTPGHIEAPEPIVIPILSAGPQMSVGPVC